MSLPFEKFWSLVATKEFMRDLMDPSKTPRVPREIRRRARSTLKHFLWPSEMERLAKKCPDILEVPDGYDEE